MGHTDQGLAAKLEFLFRKKAGTFNNTLGLSDGREHLDDLIRDFVFGLKHSVLKGIIRFIPESRKNRARIAHVSIEKPDHVDNPPL